MDDLKSVRAELAKKYGLNKDIAACLDGEDPLALEEDAKKWAKALRNEPREPRTKDLFEAAKRAGLARTTRLLDPDREAAADDLDREAIGAAKRAARVAGAIRRRGSEGKVTDGALAHLDASDLDEAALVAEEKIRDAYAAIEAWLTVYKRIAHLTVPMRHVDQRDIPGLEHASALAEALRDIELPRTSGSARESTEHG